MLEDLPEEVLLEILAHNSATDLSLVSQLSTFFYNLCQEEELWIYRANKDYKIELKKTEVFSPRKFYQKVLHKYGGLVGYWQRTNRPHYGGMLQVLFHQNSLQFSTIEPPSSLEQDLIKKQLVTISLETVDTVDITLIETDSIPSFSVSLEDNGDIYTYESLSLSCEYPGAPIQPGLFKGTYGPHGVELIRLEMTHPGLRGARGVKVTGDPNVPFSQASFIVDSDQCVDVPREMQETMDQLNNIQEALASMEVAEEGLGGEMRDWRDGLELDFELPVDAQMMQGTEIDLGKYKKCVGRWPARGQVAGSGFYDPQLIPAQFVVLEEDVFVVFFFDYNLVLVYRRVKNI